MSLPERARKALQSKAARLWKDWLSRHNVSYAQAARDLGVSWATVHHWAMGFKVPREEHRKQIHTYTRGAVPVDVWPREEVKAVRPYRAPRPRKAG